MSKKAANTEIFILHGHAQLAWTLPPDLESIRPESRVPNSSTSMTKYDR